MSHGDTSSRGQPGSLLNILFVTASYYPAVRYGGPIYTVHALAQALVGRGHRVTVYTTDANGDDRLDMTDGAIRTLDGVEVHYFHTDMTKVFWAPGMQRALAAHAKAFDVIHAHAAFVYPAVLARRAARRAGVPFVYSPRGMLVLDLIRRRRGVLKAVWIMLFEIANLRAAAFVHVTAPIERQELERLPFAPARIEVVPNGIDPSWATQPASAATRARVDSLRPYILIFGRVSWKKGIDRLIEAMRLVPGATLAVVGNDDENYTATLTALARELGVADRVVFAGPAYGGDKAAWMNGAELMVLPSYSENFGVVVLEAMTCGLPVLMTREVGIAPDVAAAGAGVVVGGTPAEIATGISALVADPALRRRIGATGRQVARDRYAWGPIAQALEVAYERALWRRPAAKGTAHDASCQGLSG